MVILVLLIGLCFGSFSNVVIARLPLKQSIVHPRSRCPKCEEPILWFDNIPVLSWLLLRGKCRNCCQRISLLYPTVELVLPVILLIEYYFKDNIYLFSFYSDLLASLIFCSLLLIISIIDIKTFKIPNLLNIVTLVSGCFFSLSLCIFDFRLIFNMFLPRLGFCLFIYLILEALRNLIRIYFAKDAFGGGDSKLLASLSMWLGIKSALLSLLTSFYIAGIFVLIRFSFKKLSKNQRIPFAPFLCCSSYLIWVFGPERIIRLIYPYS